MSKARTQVFQENIGSGFITYFRPSNGRMFFEYSRKYQERTHASLDAALSHGDLFVGYLSTYPKLSINHAVLVYARNKSLPGDELAHSLARSEERRVGQASSDRKSGVQGKGT